MALTIFAITVTFCMDAAASGLRAARSAAEIRAADRLLTYLLLQPEAAASAGRTEALSWRAHTEPSGEAAIGPIELCRRAAEVWGTGGRRYRGEVLIVCPPASPIP